jgi:ATP-dependent Clp protease ATP-binding subunit ClpA
VTIELTPEARKWLAEGGYDPKFGARPLARLIQEKIKKPLAEELLFGKLEKGGTAQVRVSKDDELAFSYQKRPPTTKGTRKKRKGDPDKGGPDGKSTELVEPR